MYKPPHFISSISGIPCGIHVDTFHIASPWYGNPLTCPSDNDYYGYSEIEYTIVTPSGEPAPDLDALITPDDDKRIRQEILTNKQEN